MIWDPWHPTWWQELKTLYRESTGKLSDALALQCAQQQATAFQMTTAQEEATEFWEASCSICGLGHWDFLFQTDFPCARNFQVTRQEETSALAKALQHCAERSGMFPRVLCDVAWDLWGCMAPRMHLERDEIVGSLLLDPMDDGPWTSPTPAEEDVLLGDEPEAQVAQQAAVLPCEHLEETPKPKDTVKQSDTPCLPATSAVVSSASSDQSCATRIAWGRARPRHPATPDPFDNPNDWVLTHLAEKWATKLVARVLVPPPQGCWATQWCPGAGPG